jgi:tetratricopeptide (TPR) repeat protein
MRPERRFVEGLAEELPGLRAALPADASAREIMRVAEGLWLVGSADEAAALLERVVRDDAWAIAPRVLLAWCYDEVGRADDAERCRARVREIDPANPYAIAAPPAAVAAAAPVIAQPAPVEPALPEPALAGEREAEPERALTAQELREIPPSPLYSATLAEIFAKQGFEEKAIEIYRALEHTDPGVADVRERLRALERGVGGPPP